MSNHWEEPKKKGADTAAGVGSPLRTVGLRLVGGRQIGMKLGVAFGHPDCYFDRDRDSGA